MQAIAGDTADQDQGHGKRLGPGTLGLDAVFQEGVYLFSGGTPPDTCAQLLADAVVKTEAHAGLVEPEEVVRSTVDGPKAVQDAEIEHPFTEHLHAVPVDDAGAFEGVFHYCCFFLFAEQVEEAFFLCEKRGACEEQEQPDRVFFKHVWIIGLK